MNPVSTTAIASSKAAPQMGHRFGSISEVSIQAQRPGSGDGERKTLLTRQIAFVPLLASVLFGPLNS
jgi:hypothetical protein